MPDKYAIATMMGIGLQYILVILIYLFLYKILKAIHIDLKAPFAVMGPQEVKPAKRQARLIVLERGNTGLADSFPIQELLSIGRNEYNDIVIADVFVSGEHANITYFKNGFWLADLNSTNKTHLNGVVVEKETELKNGDCITIGPVSFKFEG